MAPLSSARTSPARQSSYGATRSVVLEHRRRAAPRLAVLVAVGPLAVDAGPLAPGVGGHPGVDGGAQGERSHTGIWESFARGEWDINSTAPCGRSLAAPHPRSGRRAETDILSAVPGPSARLVGIHISTVRVAGVARQTMHRRDRRSTGRRAFPVAPRVQGAARSAVPSWRWNHAVRSSGGCSSTRGRYSTSWMRPSKVRLSIISRATSG